ncbi:DUF2779 domain-containing protein [Helicobacter suis]|uniref:DUF2779 domain-containing protein n=1 Tax=Helicobacter suis TaxID=104628 RepID=UPI0013D157B5|nr:DUF2779 domain-containing protein [Helicobacter suis]
MYLSKSKFLKGMQCPKMLWLEKHKQEVLSQSDQKTFRSGQEVGKLACDLFTGGSEVVFDQENMAQMIIHTQKLLDEGVNVIYEATFEYEGIFVMVDILEIKRSGGKIDNVVLNEVKSSTSAFKDKAKKKVKEVYLWDLALQYYVLKGLGFSVSGAYLICLNNTYIRKGALDLEQLFLKNDLLKPIEDFQSKIPEYLTNIGKVLESTQEPDQDIGVHCENPYVCDAKNYCWEQRGIIGNHHIFAIAGFNLDKKVRVYKAGRVFFKDLNQEDLQTLNAKQALQVTCALNDKPNIDKEAIQGFLSQLKYPLYHLDFETTQPAIPLFENTKPYAKIPFQYSIHVDFGNGKLEHQEFLADCGTDGRLALAQQLTNDIPKEACVLVYNASFEKSVLQELANLFATQHPKLANNLLQIRDNIVDLMEPFKQGHYYTPQMNGSYSIKAVLPALVPEFENAYQSLELVHNGEEAMEAYERMPYLPKEEQEKYKRALLEYCKLDTLAMVEVLEVLKRVAE